MITISTPNYEIVTVNGKDYVIFYPQFLKNGDWATVGDENPLPVKIVELDTVKFWTEQLLETSEKNKEKLEQLNELISEMSMLSKGPKGDTRYMWIKYADDENGNGMSDDPKGKKYIGLAFNKDTETPSEDPNDYEWARYYPDLTDVRDELQTVKESLNSHVNNKNNPHSVTKTQIGLGNVQNYGIALQSQAEAGISNAVYMTPLRTKQAIEALNDVEVTNTPYGKCVKHPDGTLEHFAFDVVMDRHISSSYKRADVDFTIPFIDENYYVSSTIVMGLGKNPLPYTRTKSTDSVEMAVRSISTDFVEEDEVTIDLHAVGRWK